MLFIGQAFLNAFAYFSKPSRINHPREPALQLLALALGSFALAGLLSMSCWWVWTGERNIIGPGNVSTCGKAII
jgi:hypothetical protein